MIYSRNLQTADVKDIGLSFTARAPLHAIFFEDGTYKDKLPEIWDFVSYEWLMKQDD